MKKQLRESLIAAFKAAGLPRSWSHSGIRKSLEREGVYLHEIRIWVPEDWQYKPEDGRVEACPD